MPVDARRLRRAIHLDVDRLQGGGYVVTGGAFPHSVDPAAEVCDCEDFVRRGSPCKHLLAVRLLQGDRTVRHALRLLVPLDRPAGPRQAVAS